MDVCVEKGLEEKPLVGGSREQNHLGGAGKTTCREAQPSSHSPPCAPASLHTQRRCFGEKLLLNCEQDMVSRGRRFL